MFEAPPIAKTRSMALRHQIEALLDESPSVLANAAQRGLGALNETAVNLSLITQSTNPKLTQAQLLVFAADHGVAAAALGEVGTQPAEPTSARQVGALLEGQTAVNVLARQQGFALTVVDAGLADDLDDHPLLLKRKIAHGSRNSCLAPAMSEQQAMAALNAGMEIANMLPGNVLALGSIGVGQHISCAMLVARLTQLPLERLGTSDVGAPINAELMARANLRHANALSPLHALCAFGGYELAMLCGAMLQAAAERRVVLTAGLGSGAAALVAKAFAPSVCDYLLWASLPVTPAEAFVVERLQVTSLPVKTPDLGPGSQAVMAWPWLGLIGEHLAQQAARASLGTVDAPSSDSQAARLVSVDDEPSTYPSALT